MSKTGERQMRRPDEDALLRSVSEQLLAGMGGDIGVTINARPLLKSRARLR
jgi:hypothetical protein